MGYGATSVRNLFPCHIFKNVILFIKEINDLIHMFTTGNQVGIFHYHHINEPPLKQDNDLITWKIREVMALFEDIPKDHNLGLTHTSEKYLSETNISGPKVYKSRFTSQTMISVNHTNINMFTCKRQGALFIQWGQFPCSFSKES